METDKDRELSLPSELVAAFKDRAAVEADVWRRLTPSQRARALTRFEALRRWDGGRGELGVEAAATLAGDMSVSRFYRIAAEWRDAPSLASLGVFARAGARKSKVGSDVLDALTDAARQVILLFGDMSTSALVDMSPNSRITCRAASVNASRTSLPTFDLRAPARAKTPSEAREGASRHSAAMR